MDAANLLKPLLARGELRCIGATTLNEYRQHIEKDAAFERRFQPVRLLGCLACSRRLLRQGLPTVHTIRFAACRLHTGCVLQHHIACLVMQVTSV
jgi:ATP-dependent Clp protease ATP-binding subunit ClpB